MNSRIGTTPVVLPETGSSQAWFPVKDEPCLYVTAMQVMRSGGGFYIGRACLMREGYEEPHSRESEYFRTDQDAAKELEEGFALRDAIEVSWLYGIDDRARSQAPRIMVRGGEVQWPNQALLKEEKAEEATRTARDTGAGTVQKFKAHRRAKRTTSSRAR